MESIINISGVLLLRDLSPEVRTRLGLNAVTIRNPSVKVQRGLLIREELIARTRVLQSAINPNDADEVDEVVEDETQDATLLLMVRTPTNDDCFYLCSTPAAEEATMRIIKRLDASVRSQITRPIRREWRPDASTTADIDAEKPILRRGLACVELETVYPRYKSTRMRLVPAQEVNNNGSYAELVTTEKYRRAIVQQRRVSAYVQAKPYTLEAGTQTPLRYPKTTWTQYEFAYPEMDELGEEVVAYLDERLQEELHVLEEAFLHNSHLNFYSLDYYAGVVPYRPASALDYRIEAVLKDAVRCKDKMIHAFVQMTDGFVAVAYGDQSWRASSRRLKVKQCALDFNVVLVWNRHAPMQPQQLMDTLGHDVMSLQFKDGYLLGGCTNGQVLLWCCDFTLNKTTSCNDFHKFVTDMFDWPLDLVNLQVIRPIGLSPLNQAHVNGIGAIAWLPRQIFGKFPPNTLQFYTVGVDGTMKLWNCPLDLLKATREKSKWKSSKWDVIRRRIMPKADAAGDSVLFQLKPYFEARLTPKPVSSVYLSLSSVGNILLVLGTYLGELFLFKWNPAVNHFEQIETTSGGQHDGRIMRIEKHPYFDDMLLCVGGRVFTIWLFDADALRLALTRKCKPLDVKYTDARWIHSGGGVCLSRGDGCLEFWDFCVQNNTYLETLCVDGGEILEVVLDFALRNIVVLSDPNGALIVIEICNYHANSAHEDVERCKEIFRNNAKAYSAWLNWSNAQLEKKMSAIQKRLEERKLAQLVKLRCAPKPQHRDKTKHKTAIVTPQLTFNQLETQHAIATVLKQKNLVLDEALQLQLPVREARAEELRLRRKRSGIPRRAEAMYDANLSTHLPQFMSADKDIAGGGVALPTLVPRTGLKHRAAVNLRLPLSPEAEEQEEQQYVAAYELNRTEWKAFIGAHRYDDPFVLRTALGERRRRIWTLCERRQRKGPIPIRTRPRMKEANL